MKKSEKICNCMCHDTGNRSDAYCLHCKSKEWIKNFIKPKKNIMVSHGMKVHPLNKPCNECKKLLKPCGKIKEYTTPTLEEIEKELRIDLDYIFEDIYSYTGPKLRDDELFDRVFAYCKSFYRKHIIKMMESIVPEKIKCNHSGLNLINNTCFANAGFNACIDQIKLNIKKIK